MRFSFDSLGLLITGSDVAAECLALALSLRSKEESRSRVSIAAWGGGWSEEQTMAVGRRGKPL